MSIELVLIPMAIVAIDEFSKTRKEKSENNYLMLETAMKDESLLKQVLSEWDCTMDILTDTISIKKKINQVMFTLNEHHAFSLVLPKGANQVEYKKWLNEIEEAYAHLIQQRVYEQLIYQAQARGMNLEDEEILEDNSIQLTYVIKG